MAYECKSDGGASPLFPPLPLELVSADLEELLHHTPQVYDLPRSTWRLQDVRQMRAWLSRLSIPGVCKLLKRLHLCYKRGREHVHSPDLQYDQKLAVISQARTFAQQAPEEVVFLYEDEFTFYNRPLVGRCYTPRGHKGEKATGHALKTRRIAACIDVASGEVIARQRDHFNVKEMYRFFYFVEQHYPLADVIYIALDNWPVHFHGYVQDHLAKRQSRIRFLRLPTYAPWTNPAEKVWLKFGKDLLQQHPFGMRWDDLKQAITDWFAQFHDGSEDLLRFVGLLPDEFVNEHHCAPTNLHRVSLERT